MIVNRRAMLGYAGAMSAEVLIARRLIGLTPTSARAHAGLSAQPGVLDLTLSALSAGILRISIAPADEPPRSSELGVVARAEAKLAAPGRVRPATVTWGKYTVKISDSPLQVGAYENGKLRQEIRFDLNSTDVRFNVNGPVFGLGEGVHPFDRRGTQDNMINGQHSPDLETFGARLPIPWVISPEGWGVFIG